MMHSSHVIILLIVSVVLTLQVHGQSEVSDSRRGLELLFKAPQSISHSTLSEAYKSPHHISYSMSHIYHGHRGHRVRGHHMSMSFSMSHSMHNSGRRHHSHGRRVIENNYKPENRADSIPLERKEKALRWSHKQEETPKRMRSPLRGVAEMIDV